MNDLSLAATTKKSYVPQFSQSHHQSHRFLLSFDRRWDDEIVAAARAFSHNKSLNTWPDFLSLFLCILQAMWKICALRACENASFSFIILLCPGLTVTWHFVWMKFSPGQRIKRERAWGRYKPGQTDGLILCEWLARHLPQERNDLSVAHHLPLHSPPNKYL